MTDVSLNFRQIAFAQETGYFPICLITINHDDFGSPIRLSTDPTERLVETVSDIIYGTESNSNDYYFFPCRLKLPDDTDEGPGAMQLEFNNVHRDYISTIRNLTGRPTVQVDIVMSNDVDTIEASWPEFYVNIATYDAGIITLSMAMETMDQEPFPSGSYIPSYFPGLFRGL